MALNLTNPGDVQATDEESAEDEISVAIHPDPRAVEGGWQTELDRAPDDGSTNPSPSTADVQTVRLVPASQQLVVDKDVPSSSGLHFYRARHVKAGSTAGSYTPWQGGNTRDLGDSSPILPRQIDALNIEINSTYIGSTGEVTIKAWDPFGRLEGLEFKEKDTSTGFGGTWSTDWDGTTQGVIGEDAEIARAESVPLLRAHNTGIRSRVRYVSDIGQEQTVELPPVMFDMDEIAEVTFISPAFTTGGDALVSAGVDDDGRGNRIFVSVDNTTGVTDPTTGSNDGVINLSTEQEAGRVDTNVSFSEGESLFAKARGENNAGSLGPVSGPAQAVRPSKSTVDTLLPVVKVDVDQSGAPGNTTGNFDMKVVDPEQRSNRVEFQKKTGAVGFSGSWSTGWDRSPGTAGVSSTFTRGEDIAYSGKHNVAIKWRLQYTDKDGNNQFKGDSHTFDIDRIPEVLDLGGDVQPSGKLEASGVSDEDTQRVLLTASTGGSGAAPNPTTSNFDAETTGNRWTGLDVITGIDQGDLVELRARGESTDGQLASTDHILSITLTAVRGEPDVRNVVASVDKDDNLLTSGRADRDTERVFITAAVGATDYVEPSNPTTSNFDVRTADRKWNQQDTDKQAERGDFVWLKGRGLTTGGLLGSTNEIQETLTRIAALGSTEPQVINVEATFDSSGNLLTSGLADQDTDSVFFTASAATGGFSEPANPTTSSFDAQTSNRKWSQVDTGVDGSRGAFGWVKARGQTTGGGLASTGEIQEAKLERAPQNPSMTLTLFSAQDDSTNIDYSASWNPNEQVTDSGFSVEGTFIGTDGSVAATAKTTNPVSQTTMTATDSGAGDGTASSSDIHQCELDLKEGGVVVDSKRTRTVETSSPS